MPTSALDVYSSAQRVAVSGRQLEAALLFKAARLIETVVITWPDPDRAAKMRSALEYNTRLWAVFQASMEEPDSPLPREIRLNVLQMIRFIDRRTLEVLASPEPSKLQALIDINRQIAMGLSVAEGQDAGPEAAVGGAAA
jgi:flagellar biosynthesis activator protein FlaF